MMDASRNYQLHRNRFSGANDREARVPAYRQVLVERLERGGPVIINLE